MRKTSKKKEILSNNVTHRPAVLLERQKKIAMLQQWLMFEGTRDNSFLKLLTLKKGIKLLSRSLPLFDKVSSEIKSFLNSKEFFIPYTIYYI